MYYIGIDLGTSSVKTLLMNSSGETIKTISKSYSVEYPKDGWSEQNPEDWFDQTLESIEELVKGINAADVKGLGVAGQMHGLVMLDEHDQVIRPAILWNDGRSQREVEYLNNTIGKSKISEYTGNIAFAGFTAPKILWVKENEPDNFKRIAKILLPKDYLVYRLTGEFVTDVSDAAGMLLFDVKKRCWSKEMLQLCDVSEKQLAVVHESSDIVGYVTGDLCERFGFGRVSVIAGMGDNAGAAIGTGVIDEGQCMISLGTSGTIFIPMDTFRMDPSNAIHSFCDSDGKYHLLACMLAAASCGKWWVEDILKETDYQAEQADFDDEGNNNVYFLPYLMGERSPHNDVNARGVFFGLGMSTTRTQMMKAIYEGVCFGLRDSMEVARMLGIKQSSIRVCGGGAKSEQWCQMLSDIMCLPVETTNVEEGPSFGAAILASVGCLEYENVHEATENIIKIKKVYTPNPKSAERYESRYQFFRKLYPEMKPLFAELMELNRD